MKVTRRMEALIYFAIWAAVFFLMFRFGCGAHLMGHGHGQSGAHRGNADGPVPSDEIRWIPPAKDTDPVCGKSIRTSTAKPSVHNGSVYYFCSRECREIFEAAPEQYVGASPPAQPSEPEESHA